MVCFVVCCLLLFVVADGLRVCRVLLVVRCSLFVVRCSVFGVRCLVFGVCYLFVGVRCLLLFVVGC